MPASEKNREDRVRRALAKHDYVLKKTPARSWLREYYGPGYMIIDDSNTVVEGCSSRGYESDLERVEWFAFEYLPHKLADMREGRYKPYVDPGAIDPVESLKESRKRLAEYNGPDYTTNRPR